MFIEKFLLYEPNALMKTAQNGQKLSFWQGLVEYETNFYSISVSVLRSIVSYWRSPHGSYRPSSSAAHVTGLVDAVVRAFFKIKYLIFDPM